MATWRQSPEALAKLHEGVVPGDFRTIGCIAAAVLGLLLVLAHPATAFGWLVSLGWGPFFATLAAKGVLAASRHVLLGLTLAGTVATTVILARQRPVALVVVWLALLVALVLAVRKSGRVARHVVFEDL